ncbi:hypothetical protein [Lactococcus lactis]|uniref:hypothetical protein n=1 Tax=Lactococcus lactis TaxID=1358 RepID=UPI002416D4B3|nr:hypothetical protein [Lactococcus lactis]MDG4958374.1 HNH endonuclease [Lactococcus lactis]
MNNKKIITVKASEINDKDFSLYRGFYLISNKGRIYFPTKNKNEYQEKATKDGRYYTVMIKGHRELVHRIVAEQFCRGKDTLDEKNKQLKNTVDHIDGCRYNNNAKNLEWISQLRNNQRYEANKKSNNLHVCNNSCKK